MKKAQEIQVVIADDDSITRHVLKILLVANGFKIVGEASDGEKALKLCASLKPDVLCLDINMPIMSGLEVMMVIKEQNPDLVVIMISSAATMNNVEDAFSHGAKGFIVKPFNAGIVVDTILKACADA